MASPHLLRPLARVAARQPFTLRQVNRPLFAPALSTKAMSKLAPFTPSFNTRTEPRQNASSSTLVSKAKVEERMTHLQAGMPQLIPFFFVNETVYNFGAIVILVYFMSKYALPNKVRTFLARLFISKL